jgi:hypothetical protein
MGHKRSVAWVALAWMTLAASGAAQGEEWGFSPGVKLAWTAGRGWTYGIEISVIRLPDILDAPTGSLIQDAIDAGADFITRTYGVVLNVDTNLKGVFKMRVGAEWVGPFIGLEVGPSLVVDGAHGTHLGIGFTPWVGYTVFGYYTYTLVLGPAPNLHELGAYLKSPLLGFGRSEGHHLPHIDD